MPYYKIVINAQHINTYTSRFHQKRYMAMVTTVNAVLFGLFKTDEI
jgi:hypothetical protein